MTSDQCRESDYQPQRGQNKLPFPTTAKSGSVNNALTILSPYPPEIRPGPDTMQSLRESRGESHSSTHTHSVAISSSSSPGRGPNTVHAAKLGHPRCSTPNNTGLADTAPAVSPSHGNQPRANARGMSHIVQTRENTNHLETRPVTACINHIPSHTEAGDKTCLPCLQKKKKNLTYLRTAGPLLPEG